MKKVICFIDCLTSGGAQRQIVGLSKLLKDKGYEVLVVTYTDVPFYVNYLKDNKVSFIYLDKAHSLWKRIPFVLKFFKQWNPDIVISYLDTPSIINCLSHIVGHKYKIIVSERNTTQKITLRQRIKFFLYRYADLIISNSFSQQQFIKRNYPSLDNKTITITNFVDTDYFCPAPSCNDKNEDCCNIICVGRVDYQKNILKFLEAIKIVADRGFKFKVKWYGKKFPEYYELCKNKIEDLQLESVFEFKEPSSNIKKEYQNADVFCLPSIYEGFPNVVCEAMSCGLPILCSNVCDNPNIVKEGVNGYLFEPLNVEDIADKMCFFLSQGKGVKNILGEKSRIIAVDKFSKFKFIEQYIKAIESN